MIGLPGYPLASPETNTPLSAALDSVAEELALCGALECEVDALANSAAIVIAERLREILRARPKLLKTGKLWNPGT